MTGRLNENLWSVNCSIRADQLSYPHNTTARHGGHNEEDRQEADAPGNKSIKLQEVETSTIPLAANLHSLPCKQNNPASYSLPKSPLDSDACIERDEGPKARQLVKEKQQQKKQRFNGA